MLRFILNIVIIASTLNSCVGQKEILEKSKDDLVITSSGDFRITKIDSTNSYYLIYCLKNKALHKIISKKVDNQKDLEKIELGKTYFLTLTDFLQNSENPLTGFSSSDPCFFLDDKTEICREDNVSGPYRTENLKGLFYEVK